MRLQHLATQGLRGRNVPIAPLLYVYRDIYISSRGQVLDMRFVSCSYTYTVLLLLCSSHLERQVSDEPRILP
jgi:hypothetical protein